MNTQLIQGDQIERVRRESRAASPSPAEAGLLALAPVANLSEDLERGVVGVRERVQVFLGGGDGGVAETFLDGLQVRASREQP